MTAQFEWKLEAYQKQGNLWLRWSTNAPFRAQQGRIYVYKGGFPANPTDNDKKWTWDTDHNHDWDTGLVWGTGWNCAYIAEAPKNGPYVYFMKLTTDAKMGPDVAKVVEASEVN
ncbi:MAG: hypothetical protein CMP76_10960 [Flavobacterium sp.]|uniref:hypothetical protein n=1 Tax=unclassified Flavobacterium TaxID=196869 RepID=UPI000C5816E1|nr:MULTISPECIES: hypothetical protein [unclassified Flavobacterium]MBF03804.1 hypothetical protein [Flavobacterium sp.]MCO6164394.1 hypothetical protein [Flavobacterium sp. NRK F7]